MHRGKSFDFLLTFNKPFLMLLTHKPKVVINKNNSTIKIS